MLNQLFNGFIIRIANIQFYLSFRLLKNSYFIGLKYKFNSDLIFNESKESIYVYLLSFY